MRPLKIFYNLVKVIILIITVCPKSESTLLCGHHENHTPFSNSKYHFTPKQILITSNPETKVEIVKFKPRNHDTDMSKTFYVLKNRGISKNKTDAEAERKALVSIIKALQGNRAKTPITTDAIKHQLPSTVNKSEQRADPQHSTNMHINHQVVNGHSYVYNVNNYGTHYHNYDSKSVEISNPHVIDLASPDVKKSNETGKKFEFIKLQ